MVYDNIKIDMDDLTKALTGRAGGLRPSKPKGNDLYAYIWRWARFHSGQDTCMPIMASFYLDNWLESNGYPEIGCFINTDEKKKFLKKLDAVVDEVLDRLGENKMAGALRWGQALGYL